MKIGEKIEVIDKDTLKDTINNSICGVFREKRGRRYKR